MLNRLIDRLLKPTFLSRLHVVCDETGWRPTYRTPKFVAFALRFEDRDYVVTAEPRDDAVLLVASSNARFALRRFPPALEDALERRNGRLAAFQWQMCHGRTTSWAGLVGSIPLAEWDGKQMRRAAKLLCAEVATLDAGLRRRGLIS